MANVVSASWQVEELHRIAQVDPEVVEPAIRYLLEKNPRLKRRVVISAYLDNRIKLSKAAEELDITSGDLESQLRYEGIPVRTLSQEDVEAEVLAAKQC